MACRACQKPLELLPRLGPLRRGAQGLQEYQNALLPATISSSRGPYRSTAPSTSSIPARRSFHTSLISREKDLKSKATSRLAGILKGSTSAYLIYGASEKIYKTCSAQAAYSISKQERLDGKITLGPDGEDVGVGGGIWYNDFKLLPTFSTWSQVTMLHLYLLIVRFRCLEKDVYQNWQAQLVDHFFHEAEEKMDLLHGMESRSIRQRSLQDLFQQWRGLILAYDEGLVKGDAVLASAVWRNLFKGKEDVDLRHLAAVVSWMRLCLKNLDKMADDALPLYASIVFKMTVTAELSVVDQPAEATRDLYAGLDVKATDPVEDEARELPEGLSRPLEDIARDRS